MQNRLRSRLVVFILSFLVWLGLTGGSSAEEILAGAIFGILVSVIAGHFLLTGDYKGRLFRRIAAGFRYLFKFLWEMIKANLHVAYIVVHPGLPIKPGVVRVKTKLKSDAAITILANSITLTPGTLTIDIYPGENTLFVHWITVEAGDDEEHSRSVAGRFEGVLQEVFE